MRWPAWLTRLPPRGAVEPYATVKSAAIRVSARSALDFTIGEPYPTRGLLIAKGTFLGPHASWTIVDFDRHVIARLRTRTEATADGRREATVINEVRRALPIAALNQVIGQANLLWDPPAAPPRPPRMVTDTTLDAVLFDGDDVLRIQGFNRAADPLVELVDAIAAHGTGPTAPG